MAHLPPIIGATIRPYMDFKHRVAWHSIWIVAHPHQAIHFLHEALGSGFLSEPHVRLR